MDQSSPTPPGQDITLLSEGIKELQAAMSRLETIDYEKLHSEGYQTLDDVKRRVGEIESVLTSDSVTFSEADIHFLCTVGDVIYQVPDGFPQPGPRDKTLSLHGVRDRATAYRDRRCWRPLPGAAPLPNDRPAEDGTVTGSPGQGKAAALAGSKSPPPRAVPICPKCGGTLSTEASRPEGFLVVPCLDCGLQFIQSRPDWREVQTIHAGLTIVGSGVFFAIVWRNPVIAGISVVIGACYLGLGLKKLARLPRTLAPYVPRARVSVAEARPVLKIPPARVSVDEAQPGVAVVVLLPSEALPEYAAQGGIGPSSILWEDNAADPLAEALMPLADRGHAGLVVDLSAMTHHSFSLYRVIDKAWLRASERGRTLVLVFSEDSRATLLKGASKADDAAIGDHLRWHGLRARCPVASTVRQAIGLAAGPPALRELDDRAAARLAAIERRFHALIQERVGHLWGEGPPPQLPEVAWLYRAGVESGGFGFPYGGLGWELVAGAEGPVLAYQDHSRIVGGWGRRYEISPEATDLVESGLD